MNWFKLECTTRAFVTALQLTVRYEMSVIIIIIIIERRNTMDGSSCRNQILRSKQLSSKWKKMSESEKQPFIDEAERLRLLHIIEFPNYKFAACKRSKFTPNKLVKNHHLLADELSGVCCQTVLEEEKKFCSTEMAV